MNSKTSKQDNDKGQAPFIDKARDSAHEVVDKVAHSAAELEKNAREGSQRTGETVSAIADSAKKTGQDYLGKTSRYVESNPLKALTIAVASGFLISKLVSNKRQ
jgi:ElaB/YqjD/DUF883 family membrane-anchored ribosome-binding protein